MLIGHWANDPQCPKKRSFTPTAHVAFALDECEVCDPVGKSGYIYRMVGIVAADQGHVFVCMTNLGLDHINKTPSSRTIKVEQESITRIANGL